MARKAKEEVLENKKLLEKVDESKKTTKAKATSKAKSSKSASSTKANSSKSTTSKKASTSTKKVATKTDATKRSTTKNVSNKVASTKKPITKSVANKSASTKKSTTKSVSNKSASTKKTSTKKTTNKAKTTTKKTTAKRTYNKRATTKKSTKSISLNVPEYYDLPYRYNQTIVKVLAQNPNTLFVYWDISDEDRLNFEREYGNDFFLRTKPVLVIHNLTDNYVFEIDINDFANNWYVNVNDTKCKYFVELGRRPKNQDFINTPVNYLNIAFSNTIEIPNDHILFFKENDRIYFKNIKTNKITEKVIKSFNKSLQEIYKTSYNLSERNDRFDFRNPSSQNPTSTLL